MNYARRPGVHGEALRKLAARERESFLATHAESARLATLSAAHWLNGVPMHWMRDWSTPHPLFVRSARGVELEDVDGNRYVDFCFGDTGAMFGHSPPAIARALAETGAAGITSMLPAERVARVGEKLAKMFGLPFWQMTQTATDANRNVLRWARAITGRPRVLVFDGCYHGTVEETLVRGWEGGTRARAGLIGMNHDVSATTDAVPFNDISAVEKVLARGRTAAVIAEPVLTNIGMVLPADGFLAQLRALTRRHGALLILDETHTLSTQLGGYARAANLEPDIWVCGKAIAGGMPCAVFGFTAEVAAGMRRVQQERAGGHSGMGTTLSANALALACLEASLDELMTPANYQAMHASAAYLSEGLGRLFAAHSLPWHVSRVGARLEFGFGRPPRDGAESEREAWPEVEHAIHLYLLNRGVLLTPFHNMMLCSPVTTTAHADVLLRHLADCLREIGSES
ncbi:MAG TPA: aspartate aminotransferase family protein [Steroidobacteraceae bacterium]|nr:aspartate aminotransferase family protein [Steroidobacteraceae bacterium]